MVCEGMTGRKLMHHVPRNALKAQQQHSSLTVPHRQQLGHSNYSTFVCEIHSAKGVAKSMT